MTESLDVYMDGRMCGTVSQSSAGDLGFDYDEGYRADSAATPLSLSMPLSRPHHRNASIRPFLAGLLPDNDDALAAIGREYDESPKNPFALIRHMGADVAGAIQIVPRGTASPDGTLPRGGSAPIGELDIETELDGVIEEYSQGMPSPGLTQRFSLAGAQPKIALHRSAEGVWGVPTGSTPTTHILKPVAGSFRRLDVVEFLSMRAAEALGLTVAQSELLTFGSRRAFVTRRYDRRHLDGRWLRIHQEDLCQSLAVPPQKKYQRTDGGPGVGAIASLFKSLPVPADRASCASSFFSALVFNTVLECTDAHAKNYSVILLGDRAILAPLYDLLTFAPYKSTATTYSAMQIGGEYRFEAIGEPQVVKAAATLGIDRETAIETLARMRREAVGAFETARDQLAGQDADTRDMATEVVDAVAKLPSLAR
ncbi:HipA domain-containing protein [Herbiconiux sp. CPCC 205763]|uniref:HipA domain-containing protein n=1 Tax=Herbiconiux aconitum TaxID=2970913 RepID=A0ABT2GMC9_9MICO|nr:HipA domain-containing protein [Herbiconiux aconitum]MCS5717387.1 HipA domain-containing protein [Herbiconiux aconitum]